MYINDYYILVPWAPLKTQVIYHKNLNKNVGLGGPKKYIYSFLRIGGMGIRPRCWCIWINFNSSKHPFGTVDGESGSPPPRIWHQLNMENQPVLLTCLSSRSCRTTSICPVVVMRFAPSNWRGEIQFLVQSTSRTVKLNKKHLCHTCCFCPLTL